MDDWSGLYSWRVRVQVTGCTTLLSDILIGTGGNFFAVPSLSRPSPSRLRHGRCIWSGGCCYDGAVIDETGDLSRTSIYLVLQAARLQVTTGAVETVAVNPVHPETARG